MTKGNDGIEHHMTLLDYSFICIYIYSLQDSTLNGSAFKMLVSIYTLSFSLVPIFNE